MIRLAFLLFAASSATLADDLTWTTLPTSTSAITIYRGVFASPVSSVSLEQSETISPWTTYFEAFSPAGQMVGFCMEYAGEGYTYQGASLIASNCPTLVAANTYQFGFSEGVNDISEVIIGSYLPAGPPTDVTYSAITVDPHVTDSPSAVSEPSTLALLMMGGLGLVMWRVGWLTWRGPV